MPGEAIAEDVQSPHGRLQRERDLTRNLLRLVSSASDLKGLASGALSLLREWFGCSSVGIRLREGGDFPYFETRGFPAEFVQVENA
jgi:hypothetical protein